MMALIDATVTVMAFGYGWPNDPASSDATLSKRVRCLAST